MKKEHLKDKIVKILKEETYIDNETDDQFGYEVFCDYSEHLSDKSLAEISKSSDPWATFYEFMDEWRQNAEDYYYPELLSKIESKIDDFEENKEQIEEILSEMVYWYMPEDHFNEEIHVVIALDTGDGESDFTKSNILNWYGRNAPDKIPEESPIRWLSLQQGRLDEVEKAVRLEKDEYVLQYDASRFSPFTRSVVAELENASSHMNMLIFLVSMPLFDFIRMKELMSEHKKKNSDIPLPEQESSHEVVVRRGSMCGLYDRWSGSGSLLEIDLEKDVIVPIKLVEDVWIDCVNCRPNGYGYGVDEVYGLTGAAWRGTCEMKAEGMQWQK